MNTDARIDELRKKFEENPRRYFAPLANELRKAGSLSEAIALCREFLPKQPEHMSGYIVFGQALYESGDLSEARTVFQQALALDPENLKALRHLGDIAKWEGDIVGARRWYERVLEADPRNDDIAAQLATLATPVYAVRVVPEPVATAATSFFASPSEAGPPAPASFTPAFSRTPIGLGAIPTPDAALRAVDFDAINARLREPEATPTDREPDLLDLDAHDVSAPLGAELEAGSATRASQIETDGAGNLLRGAFGDPFADPFGDAFADAVADAVVDAGTEPAVAQADHDAMDAAVADPFGFSDGPSDDMPFDEGPFEEGLIAPEWPDTSALLARMATPRSVTPPFVGSLTPDAMAAFGAEPGDPLPTPAIDERTLHLEVAAPFDPDELPPTALAASIDEESEWLADSAVENASSADDELPWLAPAPERDPDVEVRAEAIVDDELSATALFVDDVDDVDDVDLDPAPTESSFADLTPDAYNPAFVTETMGELLETQGFTTRAVSVYEELVRRRPYDPVLTSRLAELRERAATDAASVDAASVDAVDTAVPTPVSVNPVSVTPISVAPFSSTRFPDEAAAEDDVGAIVARLTARERFAQLAARRVPRRTPSRAVAALEAPADGLALLFGGDAPIHDDLAARALADAFAPIDERTHFDGEIPFAEAMLGGNTRALTPMRGATPIATAAVAEAAGSPFSFDRFFPDPATATSATHSPVQTPRNTPPSDSARGMTSPTVSDDLAQFSAWLKGLDKT